MPLKSASKSRSTSHLYEFAAEVAGFGTLEDKMRVAADSTDTTAAKNAAGKWRESRGQANPLH